MRKRLPIFIGILLVCFAVWLLITPNKFMRLFIERLDHIGYDLQLRTRVLTGPAVALSPVAIIDIDDNSLKAEGRWPWPRSLLARLVTELQKQGAAVIAFDILFSEEEKNIAQVVMQTLQKNNLLNPALSTNLTNNAKLFDEDATFAKGLCASPAVLALGFLPRAQTENTLPPPLLTLSPAENKDLAIFNTFGYISNIPVLQQAAKNAGFINIFADNDGIIRRAPLLLKYKDNVYPALALQAVLSYLSEKAQLITPAYGNNIKLEGIAYNNFIIPTDENGQVIIPFIGKSYTFPYYSATDVLHGKIPQNALTGKILFIGTSATGLGDLVATAVENPFPGVEIQATLANGILLNNFSHNPKWTFGANLLITILFGLLAAFSFPYFGPRTLAGVIILLPPLLLFINNWIWLQTGLILSFLIPVLLILVTAMFNILYGYLFESRRREQLKEMFGQYVPEKHIDEMLKASGGNYGLRGDDRYMSVLFADIRSFTTISEGLSASELVDMLNTFFTPMTEIIFKHRGTIDKYVGDLIMAFWSAPLKDRHHARHAIESALEMQMKVKALEPVLAARNWPVIHIGIGVNSGMMSVGDMGSRFRRNYTVLGDQVNLASRVESLTKFYGVDIIVTEHTQQDQDHFIFRKLDLVRVKGKKTGVTIYEVICRKSALTPELQVELLEYHKALDFYFQKNWDTALVLMNELLKTYPDKKIYQIYIQRINEFIEHPAPEDWDGIYAHATK